MFRRPELRIALTSARSAVLCLQCERGQARWLSGRLPLGERVFSSYVSDCNRFISALQALSPHLLLWGWPKIHLHPDSRLCSFRTLPSHGIRLHCGCTAKGVARYSRNPAKPLPRNGLQPSTGQFLTSRRYVAWIRRRSEWISPRGRMPPANPRVRSPDVLQAEVELRLDR